MSTKEIINELLNIRKFNYTLTSDEVFEKAIGALLFQDMSDDAEKSEKQAVIQDLLSMILK